MTDTIPFGSNTEEQTKNPRRVFVVGDLHGDFESFKNAVEFFDKNKKEDDILIFLGDYADRGPNGVEIISKLYELLKTRKDIKALKGNHEDYSEDGYISIESDLKKEVEKKKEKTGGWEVFWSNTLKPFLGCLEPAYIVGEVLFVHGGISKQIQSREDLFKKENEKILLWSDPYSGEGEIPNSRGAGVEFGEDVTDEVLQKLNLKRIVRSHEPYKARDGKPCYEHSGKVVTINSSTVYGKPFMIVVNPENAEIEGVISLKTPTEILAEKTKPETFPALLQSRRVLTKSGATETPAPVETSDKTQAGTPVEESEYFEVLQDWINYATFLKQALDDERQSKAELKKLYEEVLQQLRQENVKLKELVQQQLEEIKALREENAKLKESQNKKEDRKASENNKNNTQLAGTLAKNTRLETFLALLQSKQSNKEGQKKQSFWEKYPIEPGIVLTVIGASLMVADYFGALGTLGVVATAVGATAVGGGILIISLWTIPELIKKVEKAMNERKEKAKEKTSEQKEKENEGRTPETYGRLSTAALEKISPKKNTLTGSQKSEEREEQEKVKNKN
jgi:hypothetical protein